MKNDRMEDRRTRLAHANAVIEAISRHGRKFFHHDGNVTRFELDQHNRLWLVDKYTGGRIWMRGSHRWRAFSDGGTLRRLCEDLRDYIMKGDPIPAGHLGPWPEWCSEGDLWGYGLPAMTAVREELAGSPAIRPGGRRGLAFEPAVERMPANASISGITLSKRDLRLLMSGHLHAVRMPFIARRGWPDPEKYGHPDPKRAGFSAMTPVRWVEFRGWSPDHGPWSHFQPLDVWKNDLLWVREEWSIGAAMDDRPIEGLWPVRYQADRSVDTCSSAYLPEWGVVRTAEDMPAWASRLTLQVESVAVTPLSATDAVDLERMGLDAGENASNWDETDPSWPRSSEDPMVLTARIKVHLENVLDHVARKPQKEDRGMPDLISAESA